MNTDPRCADVRALLHDHVDGLLEPADSALVEAHLATCPGCADEVERARRIHAAFTAPWDVPAPSPDLPLLALAAARALKPRAGRFVSVALRYAATFAAGVLVAFLVLRSEPARSFEKPTEIASPVPAAPPAPAPQAEPVPESAAPTYSPRRIR
jgi:anti-sigma factor RsiW